MSNKEDYLDGLLNSMDEDDKENKEEFLPEGDADEFMRQFEQELTESGGKENPEEALADSSASTAGGNAEDGLDALLGGGPDLMALLQSEGDFSNLGDETRTETAHSNSLTEHEGETESTLEDVLGSAGATLEDILGMGDLSAGEEVPEDMASPRFAPDMEEAAAEEPKEKSNKKSSGFLKKISRVLFGEEELEAADETVKQIPEEPKEDVFSAFDADGLSEENIRLLQELEGTGSMEQQEEPEKTGETEEEEKARKKREKAERKAKEKAEKAAKKAARAAARAKKMAEKMKKKKPQEPDSTPPLPKKPVILCFVMVGSFLLLVILGTNLFGYSSSMSNAGRQFALGNYTEAYRQVAGLEMKEQDVSVYEKYRLLGNVAGEYDAYQTFMEAEMFDMALDSLVRTTGRCQKYQTDAEEYGCTGELAKLKEQAAGELSGFGITEDKALELYAIEDRSEYSAQLYKILAEAGYAAD